MRNIEGKEKINCLKIKRIIFISGQKKFLNANFNISFLEGFD